MRKLGDSISCIKTDKITDDDGMYMVHDIVEVKSTLPLNLQQQKKNQTCGESMWGSIALGDSVRSTFTGALV